MRKLFALLLVLVPLAGLYGCGTDRIVEPIYSGPPQGFGVSAVLDKAVSPGSRVFLSGSIVSASKPDSLVMFGTVNPDGHTITGHFSKNVTPNDSNFFLVLWVEQPNLVLERSLSPLRVGGIEITAIKANEFGLWWEFGLGWSESGPIVLTLRDDRPRLVDVPVYYIGNQTMGEMVSQSDPVRCKSTWSGISMPTAPWGTYGSFPPNYTWTVKALKPAPGSDPQTMYFRLEDTQIQRLYGCLVGGQNGLEMKNFKNLGSPSQPWLMFEVRFDANGVFTNPRPLMDERGYALEVSTGR